MSSSASDIYLQQEGSCLIYSSANVAYRFMYIVFYHYHPDKDFFKVDKKFKSIKTWQEFKKIILRYRNNLDDLKTKIGIGTYRKNLLYYWFFAVSFYVYSFDENNYSFAQEKLLINMIDKKKIHEIDKICIHFFGKEIPDLQIDIHEILSYYIDLCEKNKIISRIKKIEINVVDSPLSFSKNIKILINQLNNLANKKLYGIIMPYFNKEFNRIYCLNRSLITNNKVDTKNIANAIFDINNIINDNWAHYNDDMREIKKLSYLSNYGHAMTFVGYIFYKDEHHLAIKNSWGKSFCNSGFFLIPVTMLQTMKVTFYCIQANLPILTDDTLYPLKLLNKYKKGNTNVLENKPLLRVKTLKNALTRNTLALKMRTLLKNPISTLSAYISSSKKSFKEVKYCNDKYDKDYNAVTKKCIPKCPLGTIRNAKTMKCIISKNQVK